MLVGLGGTVQVQYCRSSPSMHGVHPAVGTVLIPPFSGRPSLPRQVTVNKKKASMIFSRACSSLPLETSSSVEKDVCTRTTERTQDLVSSPLRFRMSAIGSGFRIKSLPARKPNFTGFQTMRLFGKSIIK